MAGGLGSRLSPLTTAISKHLLPVYDKPLIYHPLTTLMLGGIHDILIITTPRDMSSLRLVLGDGSDWGCRFSYIEQEEPRGVADAYLLGASFVQAEPSALILGDNIFYGDEIAKLFATAASTNRGATIFGYRVADPRNFGVVEFDASMRILSLEEKPVEPRSNWAVTGLYLYDENATDIAASLRPSRRGELEITDLNRAYLDRGSLDLQLIASADTWIDAGTPQKLLEASDFVHSLEKGRGIRIACPEQVAYNLGLIDQSQVERLAERHAGSSYGDYLRTIVSAR